MQSFIIFPSGLIWRLSSNKNKLARFSFITWEQKITYQKVSNLYLFDQNDLAFGVTQVENRLIGVFSTVKGDIFLGNFPATARCLLLHKKVGVP